MAKLFSIGGNTISYGGFRLRELGSGSLTISKSVSGSGFDPTKTFELTVTFSKAVTYNGTTSTTHTFNLAHGQSVTITGIPELTTYEVVETPLSQADLDAGYIIRGITGGSGVISDSVTAGAIASNGFVRPFVKAIRIQFEDNTYDPTNTTWVSGVSWVRYSSTPNVWDCYNTNSTWSYSNFGNNWGYFAGGRYSVIAMDATGVSSTKNLFHNTYHNVSSYLTSISNVTNTGSITDMENMFCNCISLTSVQLFDTSGVTKMQSMFQWCSALTSVPLFNTQNVTSMYGMFQGCSSLTSIPLFNTSKVTNMNSMFDGCRSLTSVPLFDTSNVTSMNFMFQNCEVLTSVPLFDTGSAINMQSMFQGCSSLTAVNLFNTSKATNVQYMFRNCTSVSGGALALYTQMSTQTYPPSLHTMAFNNCGSNTTTGAAELAQIPSGWK